MIRTLAATVICFRMLSAQTAPPSRDNDPWRALSFLEGTWDARTRPTASAIDAFGTYTFRKELGGRILARHTNATGCKGPVDFDCDHSDLLFVYQESPGQRLKAIYFDNEGHVIHYGVSTPVPGSAVFISDPTGTGPQFRLVYELKGAVMEGKFQVLMPGKTEWTSYLEWSGTRK
jgi:hypothetical protein